MWAYFQLHIWKQAENYRSQAFYKQEINVNCFSATEQQLSYIFPMIPCMNIWKPCDMYHHNVNGHSISQYDQLRIYTINTNTVFFLTDIVTKIRNFHTHIHANLLKNIYFKTQNF